MYIESRDHYKKKAPLYSYLQDDKDFFDVKTEKELIKLLDAKEEHYMYFIPQEFIENVLVRKWEFMENVERVNIYPLVTWFMKGDNNYYVAVTVDESREGVFRECLDDKFREGLAITWKYNPTLIREILWMSHSEYKFYTRDWESKLGIALSLLNSQNWILFYNALDRDLNNYKYYEEIKRSIDNNISEKAILRSIKSQREEYYRMIIQKNIEKDNLTTN